MKPRKGMIMIFRGRFGFALALLFVAVSLSPGCGSQNQKTGARYAEEIAKWHAERIERLKSPTGWLSLAGLFWLSEGENTFGTDSSNAVIFPANKGPAVMGWINVTGKSMRVKIAPGVTVLHDGSPVDTLVLHGDQERGAGPTVLSYGPLTWYPIERSGRLGIRVKDGESEALRRFEGIDCFPVDPEWRIEGKLEPYAVPTMVEITNVLGDVTREPSPGTLVFKIGGKTYRLDPIAEPGDKELFVVFGDATSGKETYGGGRFLDVPRPGEDGKVIIDFNKAYNPPCAFSPYATCPLPPPENHLDIAVRAGEKTYEKPGH
jgi:uncharacterized protein (DUF1684 family)